MTEKFQKLMKDSRPKVQEALKILSIVNFKTNKQKKTD